MKLKGGAAVKRTRASMDLQPKADDPEIIRHAFTFKAMTFDKYVEAMPQGLFASFKEFIMKTRQGDRIVDWCITNLEIYKGIEAMSKLNIKLNKLNITINN